MVDTPYTAFMRDLETRFVRESGFANRAAYKIYYCQVRPASVLTLGINPGGDPAKVNADGRTNIDGSIASASSAFYENDEHDVLDCAWSENNGLLKVLLPLMGDTTRIRSNVVKTNMAFQRSAKKKHVDIQSGMDLARGYLSEIIGTVRPSLVLLTGVPISEFADRYVSDLEPVASQERDPGVKQVVFEAARATLTSTDTKTLVVRLAHASQFGWTYERYGVAEKITNLMKEVF